jgi:hypothetical protein
MSVTCIYEGLYVSGENRESEIVFSNVMTEAKRFVLLIQVELMDKFFGDPHMRKIPLPSTVEG